MEPNLIQLCPHENLLLWCMITAVVFLEATPERAVNNYSYTVYHCVYILMCSLTFNRGAPAVDPEGVWTILETVQRVVNEGVAIREYVHSVIQDN